MARLDVYQRSAAWVIPRPDRAFGACEKSVLAKVPGLQWLYRAKVYPQYDRALWFVYLPQVLRVTERQSRRPLRAQVADPELRRKLTPGYAFGCKRVLVMSTYYPALASRM